MCSLSSISCAKELVSIITRAGLVPGIQEHLHSEIDGLEELSVLLYDRGSNVCLETSNLAGLAGTTISLKEFQAPQELTGKPEEPRITISWLHPTRCIAKGSMCTSHGQCLVTIPLLEARRAGTVCHFGSLVAKIKSSTIPVTPSSQSMLGAVQLAEALSFHHAQQLREFVSVVTSLLLRPLDFMEPPPLSSTLCPPLPRHSQSTSISRRQHQNQNHEQPNSLFSTALAPLASDGVPLLGPLPRVSLLTLEFEDSSLETEFHSWKAECMQTQDLWSLFACLVVIIASVPVITAFSQLLQVGFIFMAAASTATLATSMQSSSNNNHLAFYRRHRDKIMLASSSFFTTSVYLAGGGGVLYKQVFALVAVLLPVRLRWHVSQLLLVLTWRIACTESVLSTPFNLIRLILGVVIAPFILAYLVECVARRGFLSRRALAAAAAADTGAEYEDEDEYDDEYEFYPEEEDHWLDDDDDT